MRPQLCRVMILSAGCLAVTVACFPVNLASAATGVAHAAARRVGSPPAPPPPIITSTGKHVYQDGVATNYVGTPGQFTLSDPGQVTGYIYSFGSPSVGNPVPADPDGTLTLAITPNSIFELRLYVQAVNGSSPPSQPSLFSIETVARANIGALAWWKLNAGHGTAAADSTRHEHRAALSEGQAFSCSKSPAPDGYRCTLKLNGQGDARTSPALLSIVHTRFSFSVSVWINLASCTTRCIALSQEGTKVTMFALGYRAKCALGKHGCWAFTVRSDDNPATRPTTALASVGRLAPFGRWVQLTGIFDAPHVTLTLYVNGVQKAQSNAGVVPPITNGIVRLGSGFGGTNRWPGKLSNACLFFNALGPVDVTTLYKGNATHPQNGCAALFDLYP
jgi:Concanavalin A-like lectin/glucanases superfamily